MEVGELIKSTRLRAGMTQAQLAERLGTTQSAVARLESRRANPRFLTLWSAFEAMGWHLDLNARPALSPGPDESLLAAHLALTPLERVRAHDSASASASRLLSRARLLPREA